jgi:hypothetical protein
MAKKTAPRPGPRTALPRVLLPAIFALAALLLPCTSLVGPHPSRLWRGYQTLVIRSDAGPGALDSVIDRFGTGVVSEKTATVEFWDFTGLSRVSIADIPLRIDPSDPRFDPFIAGAARYTHASMGGRAWSVAYIPSRSMPVVTWLRLSRVLSGPAGGRWGLVEFDPVQALLATAAFIAFAVMLAAALGGARRRLTGVTLAGAILWIPFLLSGGPDRFALALLMLMAWSQVMRILVLLHGWDEHLIGELREPLLLFAGSAAAGLVLLLVFGGFSIASVAGFLGPALASLLILVALAQLWGRLPRRRRRRVSFEPIPIVHPSHDSPRSLRPALILGVAALAVLMVLPVARRVPLPSPSAVAGARGFTWESLERVSRQNRAQRLPDYAEYVTHVAFQETIAFGRPWLLPARDERVYAREFVTNPVTGAFVERQRRVKVFDEAWLSSLRQRAGPGSLGALLLAQERPVAVSLRGPVSALLPELPICLLVMLSFLGMLGRERGVRPLIRGILLRFNGVARRNQVP